MRDSYYHLRLYFASTDAFAITGQAAGTTASTAGSSQSEADIAQSQTSRPEDCRAPVPTRFAFQSDFVPFGDRVHHVGLELLTAIAVDIVGSAGAPSTMYVEAMPDQRPEPAVQARRTGFDQHFEGMQDRCGAVAAKERLETFLSEVFQVPYRVADAKCILFI